MQSKKVIYFPGLNALRYIAAATVIACHAEELKHHFLLPSYIEVPFVLKLADSAVTFFFVLSGFLITYLLLKEKDAEQDINVGSFYVRRALRIWPVYYLISIMGLFIMPHIDFFILPKYSAKVLADYPWNAVLYLAFLPNFSRLFYFIPYASHLWSLGVEEQFYLFWPWIFKLVKNQLPIIVSVVVGFFAMRVACDVLGYHWLSTDNRHKAQFISSILNITRLDCMAIGGVGAYFIYKDIHWFRQIFINPIVEIASLLGAVVFMFGLVRVPILQYDVMSGFFLILLINISCSQNSLLRLEGKLWNFLGNISYSVYMYQYFSMLLVLFAFRHFGYISFGPVSNTLFHISCQIATIILANISYRFFELPFLKLKKRFTFVKSATNPV